MSLYLDTNPPVIVEDMMGLWQVSNKFTAAAREITYLVKTNTSAQIKLSRPYNLITRNALDVFEGYMASVDSLMAFVWKELTTLQTNVMILMVIEALIITPLLILWQWILIRRAEKVRLLRWALMVGLPGPVLRTLSSRPVKIAEDSDDETDEDSEAEDEPVKAIQDGSAAPATGNDRSRRTSIASLTKGGEDQGKQLLGLDSRRASVAGSERMSAVSGSEDGRGGGVMSSRSSKKTIAPSYKKTALFLVPLVVWMCALVAVYAITVTDIKSLRQPLTALNMAMHVIARFSHMRMGASMLVTQTTEKDKEWWKDELASCVEELSSEYDTLMYGGTSITQEGKLFTQPVSAAAFILPAFSALFFKSTACFRSDPSTCYEESSPWYEATRHGLDAMMQRMLTEMDLLSKDNNSDITYNNSRYDVMYHVGIADLYDGLQSSAQMFVDYSIKRYDQANQLQLILLIVVVLLEAAFLFFILRPYLALHKAETTKIAGLMSHVPHEIDVTSHARRVMRYHTASAPKVEAAKKEAGEEGAGVLAELTEGDGRAAAGDRPSWPALQPGPRFSPV